MRSLSLLSPPLSLHVSASLTRSSSPADRSANAESRLAARIDELQAALHESQATLEAERSELEGLRHDASGDATASLADDLKRVHKELSTTKADLERTQGDAAQHTALVGDLRADLRNAEKEIERLQKLTPPSPSNARASRRSSSSSSLEDPSATREQIVGLKSIIETLTEENKQLVDRNKAIAGETESLKCVLLPFSSFDRLKHQTLTLSHSQGLATCARDDRRKVRPLLSKSSSPRRC